MYFRSVCLWLFTMLFFPSPPQDQSELNSTVIRSPTNTVVIRGLKPGSIYVFQVRARTVAGFGRYSGKLYFQTMTEGENSAGVQAGTQGCYHLPLVGHRHIQTAAGSKQLKRSKFSFECLEIIIQWSLHLSQSWETIHSSLPFPSALSFSFCLRHLNVHHVNKLFFFFFFCCQT